jgi:FkbM family methyltransferase
MGYQKLIFDILFNILKKMNLEKKFYDRIERRVKSNLIDDIFEIDNSINLVFDIGAYNGDFIDEIIRKSSVCKIHAFEPTVIAFEKLKTKYKTFDNVIINNLGCSNFNGEMEFYTSDFIPTNSLLKPNLEIYETLKHDRVNDFKKLNKTYINCVKLDDYVNQKSIKEIDLIKTDTQGFDYQVLLGADKILDYTKFVVSELHFFKFYEDEFLFYSICELLYSHGFYLYNFYNLNKLNYFTFLECDALFINSKYVPLNKLGH